MQEREREQEKSTVRTLHLLRTLKGHTGGASSQEEHPVSAKEGKFGANFQRVHLAWLRG